MSHHQLPKPADTHALNLNEMIGVADKLNALLVKESLLLAAMKVKELPPLQAEKLALSSKLEAFQRMLAADDQAVARADASTRDSLYDAAANLALNIEENLRLTAIAQTVNRRVMQTFISALADQEQVSVYSNQGQHEMGNRVTVSININERA